MSVPIYHVRKPSAPDTAVVYPADNICYLIGANGLFKQVKNPFYEVRTKATGPGHLGEIKDGATYLVPPLSYELFMQIEAFLIDVYKKHKGEGIVALACHEVTKEWKIIIPPQKTNGMSVKYDLASLPVMEEGWCYFGTVHSHCAASAFHSGTDDKDEKNGAMDGLHITIGHLDRPGRDYSVRWIFAGEVYKAEMEKVVAMPALPTYPADWLEKVSEESHLVHNIYTGGNGYHEGFRKRQRDKGKISGTGPTGANGKSDKKKHDKRDKKDDEFALLDEWEEFRKYYNDDLILLPDNGQQLVEEDDK